MLNDSGQSAPYRPEEARVYPLYHTGYWKLSRELDARWAEAPAAVVALVIDSRGNFESAADAQQTHPEWENRLAHLGDLEPNWDGYGAAVVSDAAIAGGAARS